MILDNLLFVLEFLGTFAFAISGIRHAAAKQFDWFGAFVCGIAVAIGGGTVRDLLLGVPPFWMTDPVYIICTFMALAFVILFSKHMRKLENTWFVFDTIGLALFTIAGLQKTLALDYPFWVAITMGMITGSVGGVIRDVLLNNVPVIFHKEIYAMASIMGGILYWLMKIGGIDVTLCAIVSFVVIVGIRYLAVRYKISLPKLNMENKETEETQ